MRRPYRAVLALLLVLAAAPAPASSQAERAAYELDMRMDLEAGVTHGRMDVRLPAGADVARLNLEAGDGRRIEILSLSLDGRSVKPAPAGGDAIVDVPLDGARSLSVEYTAPLDELIKEPFGYYLMAPLGARRFSYPELVEPSGRAIEADFRVRLDHPSSLTVYTTGGERRSSSRGGRTVAEYEAERVRGFGVVAGEGFVVESRVEAGVPVVAFYHADYAERFAVVVDRTVEAAAWYRDTYGFFPLERVGIIQGHPRWRGGYPLPDMFVVHLGNLEDDHLAWITAHELGHYYWGGTVLTARESAGSLDLNWLMLALGIWGDQLYLAERAGIPLDEQFRRDRGQGSWFVDYLEALEAGHEQDMLLSPQEQASLDFDYNSLIRHGKAATGLYLQSMLIGADRFLDLQRRLLDEYAGRALHPDDFIAALERAGSPDARRFFDAWYRHNATVDVVVDGVEPDPAGGWRVLLQRTGSVPYPVTVAVETAEGERRHVVAADAAADTIRSRAPPVGVVVDPDGMVPMPNSSHPKIRGAIAAAMDRARRDEDFTVQARAVLEATPDDHYLRYRLARRLFSSARYEEAAAAWPDGAATCEGRNQCLAGYYAAQSLERLGRKEAAAVLAAGLAEGAEEAGLGAVWQQLQERLRAN